MTRSITVLIFLTISFSLHAGEVDIPNQFQANTPAVAAEVNANFDAVEVAVDDNAQRIVTLEDGLGTAGIAVRVGGNIVGRFLESGSGFSEVAVASGGTEQLAQAQGIANTRRLTAVSATGYFFELQTADNDHPFLMEGNLSDGFRFFETTDCTGNAYRVIEGDTGFFSVFKPGTGQFRPIKPWFARQGWVFSSPDPNDATPVWMVRRGAVEQIVALGSFLVYARQLDAPFCVEFANLQGYDINNPMDVNHTVVPAEPNDSAETGITGILGGEVSVGL